MRPEVLVQRVSVCNNSMPSARMLIMLYRRAGYSSPHGPSNYERTICQQQRCTARGQNRRTGSKPDVLDKRNDHVGRRGRCDTVAHSSNNETAAAVGATLNVVPCFAMNSGESLSWTTVTRFYASFHLLIESSDALLCESSFFERATPMDTICLPFPSHVIPSHL